MDPREVWGSEGGCGPGGGASQPLTGSVPGLDPAEGSRRPHWAPASRAGEVVPICCSGSLMGVNRLVEWRALASPGSADGGCGAFRTHPAHPACPFVPAQVGGDPVETSRPVLSLWGLQATRLPTPAARVPWAGKGAGAAPAGPGASVLLFPGLGAPPSCGTPGVLRQPGEFSELGETKPGPEQDWGLGSLGPLCLSRPLPRPHVAVHRWPGPALLPLRPGEVLTPGVPTVILAGRRPGCWEPCWRAVRALPLPRPPACGEKAATLSSWAQEPCGGSAWSERTVAVHPEGAWAHPLGFTEEAEWLRTGCILSGLGRSV